MSAGTSPFTRQIGWPSEPQARCRRDGRVGAHQRGCSGWLKPEPAQEAILELPTSPLATADEVIE